MDKGQEINIENSDQLMWKKVVSWPVIHTQLTWVNRDWYEWNYMKLKYDCICMSILFG